MKLASLLAVAALFLLSFSAQSQIVIVAQEVPHTVGAQFQYYSEAGDSLLVNVGNLGGPQTWDFTQGDTSFISTDLYLDPQISPPEYARANVVIQTDQLNMAGLTEPGIMYCYLHRARFILGAVSTEYEGNEIGFMFQPYVNQFTLPLQMGSSWSNNINVDEEFQLPEYDVRIELYATINSSVDAYGTAMVPLGNYETLRIHNVVTYDYTIYVRILFVWVPVYSDAGTTYNYDWRAENTGTVLSVIASTPDPGYVYASGLRRLMSTSTLEGESLVEASLLSQAPKKFDLMRNYPNPFNAETTISYNLSAPANVDLRIFDVMGRQVAVLQQGFQAEGLHELRWTPDNLAAGLYIIHLRAGGQVEQRPMLYLK